MPYEAHECLRSHRGVDLTGKLRVWLSPIFSIERIIGIVNAHTRKAERNTTDVRKVLLFTALQVLRTYLASHLLRLNAISSIDDT